MEIGDDHDSLPVSRRRRWTQEEDISLAQAVEQLGPRKWGKVSHMIPGRNASQCRERWCVAKAPSAPAPRHGVALVGSARGGGGEPSESRARSAPPPARAALNALERARPHAARPAQV